MENHKLKTIIVALTHMPNVICNSVLGLGMCGDYLDFCVCVTGREDCRSQI